MKLFIAVLIFNTSFSFAVIFNVTTTDDLPDNMPGNGICSVNNSSDCSLRAAIIEANLNAGIDIINIPNGVYQLTFVGAFENSAVSGDLDITDSVNINGSDENLTIIDGILADRVFHLHGGQGVNANTLSLSNLSIIKGKPPQQTINDFSKLGSGVFVEYDQLLELNHVTFKENENGSVILNKGGVNADNISFIQNQSDSSLPFIASGITNIHEYSETTNVNAILNIQNCVFKNNFSEGVAIIGSQNTRTFPLPVSHVEVFMDRCSFIGNQGHSVSVIYNDSKIDMKIYNSTFSQNINLGGQNSSGILFLNDGGSEILIANSTLYDNSGSVLLDVHGGFGFITIQNSVIELDDNPIFITSFNSNGGNYISPINMNDRINIQPTDLLSGDLNLSHLITSDTRHYSLKPLPGSILVDSALNQNCTLHDINGTLRPLDGDSDGIQVCDIGAVEVNPDLIFQSGFEI
ncbi:MAG TPA: hypothetical protein PK055_06065 [Gammaproteobacteria bacterium]|nr:hypothetical protein [Xanthomonadales bacterium]MCB1594488.1 hypothetical protein [Xanthomonadales bacterium]HOP22327.1 hypothetical protein [Gammaproteobacteria bacterium]HPI96082.1 hypothetical protein [Gammaproteobacteria bacterium]HPQ87201.1 hypothetical protein [Gammaproteobacteria bacterium]